MLGYLPKSSLAQNFDELEIGNVLINIFLGLHFQDVPEVNWVNIYKIVSAKQALLE